MYCFIQPDNQHACCIVVIIIPLQITDGDLGVNSEVDFSLEPSAQSIFYLVDTGPSSIELYLNSPLDREVVTSSTFRIFVIDRGLPPLVGQTEIRITVLVGVINKR